MDGDWFVKRPGMRKALNTVLGVSLVLFVLGLLVIVVGFAADARDVGRWGALMVLPLMFLFFVGVVLFVVGGIVSVLAIRNPGERKLCIGLFSALAIATAIGLLIRLL